MFLRQTRTTMPKWTFFLILSKILKVSNSQSKKFVLITEIFWRIFWPDDHYLMSYKTPASLLRIDSTPWKLLKADKSRKIFLKFQLTLKQWMKSVSVNFFLFIIQDNGQKFLLFLYWWFEKNIYLLSFKGQLISKANCQAVNSSIKRMNEFVFTTMQRAFVEDTKKKNGSKLPDL